MPIDLQEHLKKKKTGDSGSNNNDDRDYRNQNNNNNKKGPSNFGNFDINLQNSKAIILAVAVLIFIVLLKPFAIINSGEVGIKKTMGKYEKISLKPGIHFFVPIIQDINVVDTKVRIINFSTTENMGKLEYKDSGIFKNDAINILDARGLPVSVELTVQYSLNAENASTTIAKWGMSWEQKIVNPVVRDVVRSVIGGYPAEELPVKRNAIAAAIVANIKQDIDSLEHTPVKVNSVQLREIVLPKNIKDQIEKVQIARQETERAKYEVEKAKQEAMKVVVEAKGQADSAIAKARGEAQSVVINSKATADANKLISESLTSNLLKLKQIEVQGKFNEALRDNQNANLFISPAGASPNVWLNSGNNKLNSSISK